MLFGEQMNDRMFVPVFTFWHPPFWFVNENCRPLAPAGQFGSWNAVTQWLPDPPSTCSIQCQHAAREGGEGAYAEGVAVVELVARAVAGDVQPGGAVAGAAAEGGDSGVGCLGEEREHERGSEVRDGGSGEAHRCVLWCGVCV